MPSIRARVVSEAGKTRIMDAIERQQNERNIGATIFAIWLLICIVTAGVTASESDTRQEPARPAPVTDAS